MNAIANAAAAFAEHQRRRTRIATEAAILMRSEFEQMREQAARVPALRLIINDLNCEIRGLRLELAGKDQTIKVERFYAGLAAIAGLLAFAWVVAS